MKPWMLIIGLAVIAAVATGLNPTSVIAEDEESDPCKTTVLQRFEAYPVEEIWNRPQQPQIILWSAFGAKSVELSEDQEEWETVDDVGTRIIKPTHDTRYWLRVTNPDDWSFVTSAKVDVFETPLFMEFDVTPSVIEKGESAELSWTAIHSDFVLISTFADGEDWPHVTPDQYDDMTQYPAEGKLTVSPTETTNYALMAVDSDVTNHISHAGARLVVNE